MTMMIIPIAVGLFGLYDARSVQDLPHTAWLFAGVVAAAGIVTATHGKSLRVPRRAQLVVIGFLLLTPIYLAVSLLQDNWLGGYVIGDLMVVTLPLLMMLGLLAEPRILTSSPPFLVLGGLLLATAIEARLIGDGLGRSDPPSVLLIAITWALALQREHRFLRVVGWGAALLVGYLSFASGYRTHFLLWLIALPLLLLVLRGVRATVLASTVITALLAAAPAAGLSLSLAEVVQGSRFNTVLASESDASLQSRFEEAADAVSTASETWLPGQVVVGAGFGATYIPQRVIIEQNVNQYGTVHSIHIGPVLVFFRFGVVGLLLLAGLVRIIVAAVMRARHQMLFSGELGAVVFSTGAALFCIDFLLRNSSVQPAMAMCIGAVLAMWCQPPAQAAEPGERGERGEPALSASDKTAVQ